MQCVASGDAKICRNAETRKVPDGKAKASLLNIRFIIDTCPCYQSTLVHDTASNNTITFGGLLETKTEDEPDKLKDGQDLLQQAFESTLELAADEVRLAKRKIIDDNVSPELPSKRSHTSNISVLDTEIFVQQCTQKTQKGDIISVKMPPVSTTTTALTTQFPAMTAPAAATTTLETFFKSQNPKVAIFTEKASCPQHSGPSSNPVTTEALIQPLPPPGVPGLSCLQHLFAITTGVDPRALTISSDKEIFAFMDLQYEHRWTSFGMTSQRWVETTELYNVKLEEIGRRDGIFVSKKHPDALFEKLGDIEEKVIERIRTARKGSKDFWRKHCTIILFVKIEPNAKEGDMKLFDEGSG
ncbi:hypothetical protein SERLA73DRAFT_157538 [Serpula lacrymans var. lacrymans S7.3]|uniref:Uncharacterized protein n=1 Tax=Serpula lacrymans var. lacrymans (strain S7.3) TaxID=936435 RepID=F8QJL2_SERL3|nr:hypothetical protein SERLA73DRAFT_157538 [Serpula lacrymans var. lacrymans S7.3]